MRAKSSVSRRLLVVFPFFALSVACSSSAGESEFGDRVGGRDDGANVDPRDPSTFGRQNADGGSSGSSGSSGGPGSCGVASTEAKLTPVNLIVMFDQSGSMGDTTENPSYDPKKRWEPVRDAMSAFFSDASSVGMRAALTFFPSATNSCAATDYSTAEVPLTALPSPVFAQRLNAHAPKGDTPTRAAIAGAIAQAQGTAASHPADKTVIVLVTDGEPYGCGVSTQAQSSAAAAAAAADVGAVKASHATYVIGVGPSVGALDAVAQAGGTSAFHVTVGTPSTTTTQLLGALAQIRGALGQCDFDIPPPPDGRAIDFGKVNVDVTRAATGTQTLPYAADCAGGNGWHFDDAANPKKVSLCKATCDSVKAESGGKVNVSFGCVDRPDVVR